MALTYVLLEERRIDDVAVNNILLPRVWYSKLCPFGRGEHKHFVCYYFIFPILIENKSSDFKENKQTKAS